MDAGDGNVLKSHSLSVVTRCLHGMVVSRNLLLVVFVLT